MVLATYKPGYLPKKPLDMYVLGAHGRHQYIHLKGPQRRLTFWIPKGSMSYTITTSIPYQIPDHIVLKELSLAHV